MTQARSIFVNQLKLDLTNFRLMPQADEAKVVNAIIASRAEYFWALMESLIDDGYLPTDNIIVLKTDANPPEMIVKEGNRRIAALKIVHGYIHVPNDSPDIPDSIAAKLDNLSAEWKSANAQVPCAVFEHKDASRVDRIVTLAHGKGEKAGRDQWSAVARARHNRNMKGLSEPALDLLEKYLQTGQNLTSSQKERWAGYYTITVLEETMKRLAPRLGASSAPDLARKYPAVQHRDSLDNILRDIGLELIGFKHLRSTIDFASKYGVPLAATSNKADTTSSDGSSTSDGNSTSSTTESSGDPSNQAQGTTPDSISREAQQGTETASNKNKSTAVAINDPRAVKKALRQFKLLGNNREKVVTLRKEALQLKLKDNPIAFCLLLRSMFEISAKAYCDDHKANGGPSATKVDGQDRKLVDILRDITTYMTTLPNQKRDTAKLKLLHGALTELAKSESILSVTSMNNLVHNAKFAVTEGDISTMFGNIFPLLEEMNS